MQQATGEIWRFTTHAGQAQQVFLAIDGAAPSRWIEMQPISDTPGSWSVVAEIAPGRHRLRYFTVEDGTYLNCGSTGLIGERTSTPDPAVQIDDMRTGLAVSA